MLGFNKEGRVGASASAICNQGTQIAKTKDRCVSGFSSKSMRIWHYDCRNQNGRIIAAVTKYRINDESRKENDIETAGFSNL